MALSEAVKFRRYFYTLANCLKFYTRQVMHADADILFSYSSHCAAIDKKIGRPNLNITYWWIP